MKRLLMVLAMVLLLVGMASADTFVADINGVTGKLVFTQAPFGPGETGNCDVWVDDAFKGSSSYMAVTSGDVKYYYAFGLMFIWDGNYLTTYQPLQDLTFTKQE